MAVNFSRDCCSTTRVHNQYKEMMGRHKISPGQKRFNQMRQQFFQSSLVPKGTKSSFMRFG